MVVSDLKAEMQRQRYIIMPAQGFRSNVLAEAKKLRAVGTAIRISASAGRESTEATTIRVLHSTHDDGPKLVEMTQQAELNLHLEVPGLKVIPIVVLPNASRTATRFHTRRPRAVSDSCAGCCNPKANCPSARPCFH